MPDVTVVMPAYNAEKFVCRALDSLLDQTYKDWCLNVVNDGSTDNTLSILNYYAAKDKRINVYTIDNSGAAKYPRDMAIVKSDTKFILCLDADDFISKDYIESMLLRQYKTDADIVFPIMNIFSEATGVSVASLPVSSFDNSIVYKGKDLVKYILDKWDFGCNGGLYRRSVINNLTYPDLKNRAFMNSDEIDSRRYLINSDKVAFSQAVYYYSNNENSITKRFGWYRFQRIDTNNELVELIYQTYGDKSLEYFLSKRLRQRELIALMKYLIENKKNLNKDRYKLFWYKLKDNFTPLSLRSVLTNFDISSIKLSLNFNLLYLVTKTKYAIKG